MSLENGLCKPRIDFATLEVFNQGPHENPAGFDEHVDLDSQAWHVDLDFYQMEPRSRKSDQIR